MERTGGDNREATYIHGLSREFETLSEAKKKERELYIPRTCPMLLLYMADVFVGASKPQEHPQNLTLPLYSLRSLPVSLHDADTIIYQQAWMVDAIEVLVIAFVLDEVAVTFDLGSFTKGLVGSSSFFGEIDGHHRRSQTHKGSAWVPATHTSVRG